ncbi:MAG: formylglycine-generating enzyme family protein [Magnetococcales bacterium]|nr:formylglycine-generating enzyme family protein [Magnetococcales bacterium]
MKETLKNIQRRLAKNSYSSPEQVCFSLVVALLSEMGWDPWNPEEIRIAMETTAEAAVPVIALAVPPDNVTKCAIEVRRPGSLGKDSLPTARPPARVYALTDGRVWRFYFQDADKSAPDQCVKVFDLLQQQDLADIENNFRLFLSRDSVQQGTTIARFERKATASLNRKLEPLRKALPRARQLAAAPPNPPLEKVLAAMMTKAGFIVTMDDISQFLQMVAEEEQATQAVISVSSVTQFEKKEWVEPITGMEFLLVPGGTFIMGSPDDEMGRLPNEGPMHAVTLDPFWLAKNPVTVKQWRRIMEGGGRTAVAHKMTPEEQQKAATMAAQEDYPVEQILWDQAQEFIKKLGLMAGASARLRLPTEAEWEYAARAGTTGKFPGDGEGGKLDDYAWYSTNSGGKLQKITLKKANAWGVHDILGNVWEWVADRYAPYTTSAVSNPKGATTGGEHIRRGGSYRSNNKACRFARRNHIAVDELELQNSGGVGFRLARDA